MTFYCSGVIITLMAGIAPKIIYLDRYIPAEDAHPGSSFTDEGIIFNMKPVGGIFVDTEACVSRRPERCMLCPLKNICPNPQFRSY